MLVPLCGVNLLSPDICQVRHSPCSQTDLGWILFGDFLVVLAWAICLISLNLRESSGTIIVHEKNDTANSYPNWFYPFPHRYMIRGVCSHFLVWLFWVLLQNCLKQCDCSFSLFPIISFLWFSLIKSTNYGTSWSRFLK